MSEVPLQVRLQGLDFKFEVLGVWGLRSGISGYQSLGLRVWILGFRFWVLGFGFWVLGVGFWGSGFGSCS